MIDPLDTKVINELEALTGLKIIPFVGIISEISAALQSHYKLFAKDEKSLTPPIFIKTKTYVGKERRNSVRYAARIDIQFPAGGYYLRSRTMDVSRDGFAFRSERPVELGAVLTLEVDLPPTDSPLPIAAITQVIRCFPKEDKAFEVAVRTLKIIKDEMGVIVHYAARHEVPRPDGDAREETERR
jgi:hypothetical protein